MKKIPCLFQRDHSVGSHNTLVRDEVTPGCEWVLEGEGIATRKWDGTCCLIRDGKLYKRYEVKRGKKPPADFEPACEVDPNTGKQQGWRPVGDGPEDKWFRQAFEGKSWPYNTPVDGTYELIGPKVQGDAERHVMERWRSLCPPKQWTDHRLVPHGQHEIYDVVPRTYAGLKEFLTGINIEGIVFWHPDGRMAKIRAKDFGLPRVAGQRNR